MALSIADAPARSRYEAHEDGTLAGVVEYVLEPERIALVHTEVDPAFEGRGIAGALARFALEDARGRGLRVIPVCPFVRSYLKRHPEYGDVVAGGGPAVKPT